MKIKTYALGKTKIIGSIVCSIFWFAVVITCAIYVLATDMYDGKNSVIIFVVLICSAAVTGLFLIYLKQIGIYTTIYITDAGIICKNKLLQWDEIKITGFAFNDKQPQYYLLFDREYQSGRKNLIRKKQRGAYVILDECHLNGIVPIILDNIKSKVVFLNIDGETEANIENLPLCVKEVFENHIAAINNAD